MILSMAKRLREASFCYKLEESRRTKRWPLRALFDKEYCRRVFQLCGVDYAKPVRASFTSLELVGEDLAGGVVVKPKSSHSGRGVLALTPEGKRWRELIAGGLHTLAEVRERLQSERVKWNLQDRWVAEELLTTAEGQLPNDVKVYAFHGRVGCVLVRSSDLPRRYHWFSAGLESTSVGKGWYVIDHSLTAPAGQTLDEVARVSRLLPVPFLRIDVYETPRGVVFGELTPYPGNYESFNDEWDRRLGGMYEEAESDLIASMGPPRMIGGTLPD